MADSLVIRNATIIDGTGAAPVGSATIVIEGGRIVAAGTGDQGGGEAESSGWSEHPMRP